MHTHAMSKSNNATEGRIKDRTEKSDTQQRESTGINSWVQRNRLFEMHATTGAKRVLAQRQKQQEQEIRNERKENERLSDIELSIPVGHTRYSWVMSDSMAVCVLPGHTAFSLGL
jgi:hypothetical protein